MSLILGTKSTQAALFGFPRNVVFIVTVRDAEPLACEQVNLMVNGAIELMRLWEKLNDTIITIAFATVLS